MTRRPRIACIAGARPNFMKIAPIMRALQASERLEGTVIHTGQHYDANMSEVFFAELGIPAPSMNLDVGSGAHGVQTGRVMIAFEEAFDTIAPDLVLVVGDVNSTIACALVAQKRGVPVAHVEAGLRSFDRGMPEEINRVLTDQIADLLFTTEEIAVENLASEGIDRAKVHFVGNTMIDTLAHMLPKIKASTILDRTQVEAPFGVVTFHRPSNVDHEPRLRELSEFLCREAPRLPLVFPVHPRTRAKFEAAGLWAQLEATANLTLVGPLPYTDFMQLVRNATVVITDSGGIQEETTWLGVPCLTQRTSTERPSTVEIGTNTLLGEDFTRTSTAIGSILDGTYKQGTRPPLWDGQCAPRVVAILERYLQARHD